MDVLADASFVASQQDDDAAQILNQLRAHHESGTPTDEADEDFPNPDFEDNAGAHIDAFPWLRAEDDLLRRLATKALAQGGARRGPPRPGTLDPGLDVWDEVAQQFEGRTALQCLNRWQQVLNPENIKGMPARAATFSPTA